MRGPQKTKLVGLVGSFWLQSIGLNEVFGEFVPVNSNVSAAWRPLVRPIREDIDQNE